MKLAPTRFVTIVGSEVTVKVTSAAEAKLALKEIRHKRRELKLHRRALAADLKAETSRRTRTQERPRRLARALDATNQFLWHQLVKAIGGALPPAPKSAAAIEAALRRLDATLWNLDAVELQVEGKLLRDAGS